VGDKGGRRVDGLLEDLTGRNGKGGGRNAIFLSCSGRALEKGRGAWGSGVPGASRNWIAQTMVGEKRREALIVSLATFFLKENIG